MSGATAKTAGLRTGTDAQLELSAAVLSTGRGENASWLRAAWSRVTGTTEARILSTSYFCSFPSLLWLCNCDGVQIISFRSKTGWTALSRRRQSVIWEAQHIYVSFIFWVYLFRVNIVFLNLKLNGIYCWCSKKPSGWFIRLWCCKTSSSSQTFFRHVYCSFPMRTHARSTFWMVGHSPADLNVCVTFAFFLLGLPATVLIRLSWVAT